MNMNKYTIIDDTSVPCSTIFDLFFGSKLVASKSDFNRLMKQGGLYLNDEKVSNNREITTDDFLYFKYILLRKGKSNYFTYQFNGLKEVI